MKKLLLAFALCLFASNAFAASSIDTSKTSSRPKLTSPDARKWESIKDIKDKKFSFRGNKALYETNDLAVDATAKLDLPTEDNTSRVDHYGLTISVTFAL